MTHHENPTKLPASSKPRTMRRMRERRRSFFMWVRLGGDAKKKTLSFARQGFQKPMNQKSLGD
jgi:hypothetical protein